MSNLQKAISSYLVLIEDIIWLLVKHRVMILGFYRVRLEKMIQHGTSLMIQRKTSTKILLIFCFYVNF